MTNPNVSEVDVDESTSKRCGRCLQVLPFSEFYRLKTSRDGHQHRCKPCTRAYLSEYRAANKKRIAEVERKRTGAKPFQPAKPKPPKLPRVVLTPEERAERKRLGMIRWRRENPDKVAAQNKAWGEANRERRTELNRLRRARRAAAHVEDFDPQDLWTGFCGLCGEVMDPELAWPHPFSKSVDHIIPLARGGEHSRANVQWAHLRCNVAKGARVA